MYNVIRDEWRSSIAVWPACNLSRWWLYRGSSYPSWTGWLRPKIDNGCVSWSAQGQFGVPVTFQLAVQGGHMFQENIELLIEGHRGGWDLGRQMATMVRDPRKTSTQVLGRIQGQCEFNPRSSANLSGGRLPDIIRRLNAFNLSVTRQQY